MPDWLAAVAAVLLSALILSAHVRRVETHMVEHVDRQVNHLKGVIDMSGQDTVKAQVDAGVPAEELDFSELTAAAQALDDIVPDAPVDDVPVADEPVTPTE